MKWSVIKVMKTNFPSHISTAAVTLCGAQCVGCFLPARCQILNTLKMSIPIICQTLDETFLLSSAFVVALAFLAVFQFHEKEAKTAKYVNKSTRKIILCLVSLMYIWHRGLYLYMIIMLGEKLIMFVHKASIYVWSASKQYRFVLCIIQPEGIKKKRTKQ